MNLLARSSSLAVALSLCMFAARAHAAPPKASSSEVPEAEVAPTARLRVDATCAEGMAYPSSGLRVLVDGAPQTFLHVDQQSFFFNNSDGNLAVGTEDVDVAYTAPTGMHVVRIEADGCTPMERRVRISPFRPTFVSATMPIEDESLQGPTGAPDGITLGFSAFRTSLPTRMTNDVSPSRSLSPPFVLDDPKIWGGVIRTGWAHRSFLFSMDIAFGMGSGSGTTVPKSADVAPKSFTSAMLIDMGMTLRLGHRFPLGAAALEVGSGLGADIWIVSAEDGIGDVRPTWDVPLWADLVMKPSCDVGVELGAQYRYEPGYPEWSTTMLSAGLVLQPTGACHRSPSFEVS